MATDGVWIRRIFEELESGEMQEYLDDSEKDDEDHMILESDHLLWIRAVGIGSFQMGWINVPHFIGKDKKNQTDICSESKFNIN